MDQTTRHRRTNEEIRKYVEDMYGHLPKGQRRKIRADLEYVERFYEADGITPSAFGRAVMAETPLDTDLNDLV